MESSLKIQRCLATAKFIHGTNQPSSYHHKMRILLLALMIILLPLRGWMGDVMALEMATSKVVAINKIAAHAYSTGSRGQLAINSPEIQPACPGHTEAAMAMNQNVSSDANAPDSQNPATHGQCSDCSACQICHSVALTAATPLLAALAQPHPLRPASSLQFASATTAPRLKPPII